MCQCQSAQSRPKDNLSQRKEIGSRAINTWHGVMIFRVSKRRIRITSAQDQSTKSLSNWKVNDFVNIDFFLFHFYFIFTG